MAEDIVQDALIRAWPHTERLYRAEGSARGRRLTGTRNLVVDRQRIAAARREIVGADDRDLPDRADAVLTSVADAVVLRWLSQEHREVLCTCLCDRTVERTAWILGIPAGNVKSRSMPAS